MDDQSTPVAEATTPDEQTVVEPQTQPTTQDEQPIAETPDESASEQPQVEQTQQAAETPVAEVEEEEDYQYQPVQELPQIDFNNLTAGEDGLIDPNELAGAINQQMNSAVEAARQAARNEYLEQRADAFSSVTTATKEKKSSNAAEQRQMKKDLVRLERQMEKCSAAIANLTAEQETAAFDADRLVAITAELAVLTTEATKLEEEWLQVTLSLEG